MLLLLLLLPQVLEPRRVAAKAAARRMAALLGEPVGKTVGYRVRLENKVSQQTVNTVPAVRFPVRSNVWQCSASLIVLPRAGSNLRVLILQRYIAASTICPSITLNIKTIISVTDVSHKCD